MPDRPGAAREAPGRLARGQPIAIIDIGSNSVRLVAYEGLTRALTPLYNEKVLCGLGRNVATTGRLDEEAAQRALKALARFRLLCEMMGVGRIWVLATAAARDASNGQAFLEAASAACGQPIQLLSGQREAQLAAAGVVAGFYAPDGIVGDLGGGSLVVEPARGCDAAAEPAQHLLVIEGGQRTGQALVGDEPHRVGADIDDGDRTACAQPPRSLPAGHGAVRIAVDVARAFAGLRS